MKIANNVELDQWLWDRRDHYLVSVQGTLPIAITDTRAYLDCINPIDIPVKTINVKWIDKDTGEVIDIIYEED